MSQGVANTYFSQQFVEPYYWPHFYADFGAPVAPNQTINGGQIVALTTHANAFCVQTITATGGSGANSFQLQFYPYGLVNQTVTIAGNANAATVAAALNALGNIGAGGVVCAGSLSTGMTVTFANYGPMPILLAVNVSSGLTIAIAMTTPGYLNGAIVAYNGAQVVNPTTAPSLSAAGADGTLAVGSYVVSYTYVTAAGESLPSNAATIAVASTNHIAVASITSIPTGVTSVNVYINDVFALNQAVTGGATGGFNILAMPAASGSHPPNASTAFLNNDGSQIPVGILKVACATDAFGNVTYGSAPGGYAGQAGLGMTGLVIIKGYYNTSLLTGLDANTVSKLGRMIQGSIAGPGVFALY